MNKTWRWIVKVYKKKKKKNHIILNLIPSIFFFYCFIYIIVIIITWHIFWEDYDLICLDINYNMPTLTRNNYLKTFEVSKWYFSQWNFDKHKAVSILIIVELGWPSKSSFHLTFDPKCTFLNIVNLQLRLTTPLELTFNSLYRLGVSIYLGP